MDVKREFIEIENLKGETQKVEVFAEIKSKRDDKVYVLLTPDETIGDEVNISIGHIHDEDGKIILELVESEEEIKYVSSLLDEVLAEELV